MVVNQRKRISKPWGYEEILHESDDLVVLRMFLKAGEETSLHKHLKRNETFTVLKGRGTLALGGRRIPFGEGEVLVVEKGKEHRWFADEDTELIEVTKQPMSDSVRLDDKYGRA